MIEITHDGYCDLPFVSVTGDDCFKCDPCYYAEGKPHYPVPATDVNGWIASGDAFYTAWALNYSPVLGYDPWSEWDHVEWHM